MIKAVCLHFGPGSHIMKHSGSMNEPHNETETNKKMIGCFAALKLQIVPDRDPPPNDGL